MNGLSKNAWLEVLRPNNTFRARAVVLKETFEAIALGGKGAGGCILQVSPMCLRLLPGSLTPQNSQPALKWEAPVPTVRPIRMPFDGECQGDTGTATVTCDMCANVTDGGGELARLLSLDPSLPPPYQPPPPTVEETLLIRFILSI